MLRDGHAARLHLRRRPDRPRRCRRSTARARAAPTTSPRAPTSRSRSCSTRPSPRSSSSSTSEVEVRDAQPGRRVHDPARPEPHQRGLRLDAEDAARGGRRARAIEYYREHGIDADVHPPQGSSRRSSRPSERARRDQRPRRRRRRLRRLQPRPRAARRATRARVLVVDNLLSAERENVPDDARVAFVEGSIADDGVLARLDDDFDYVFHLATYHGNQSSIADPLADHEHNLITTLKLFERLKDLPTGSESVVYAASGCTLARAHLRRARRRRRGRAGAARPRQPVPDLQGRGRVLLRLLPPRDTGSRPCVRASRTSTDPARSSAPAAGAGPRHGLAQRDADLRLPRAQGHAAPTGQRRPCHPRLHLRRRHRRRTSPLRDRGEPGDVYNLASGVETSIRELAETINRMAGNDADVELAPGAGLGPVGPSVRQHRESPAEARLRGPGVAGGRSARTVDWTRENLSLIDACVHRHAQHMSLPLELAAPAG